MKTPENRRITQASVDPQFPDRWSPRAFSSEPLSEDEILSLFEAARWAPSSFNLQPWRFLYAHTEKDLKRFCSLLDKSNAVWAGQAPLLIFVLARRINDHNGSVNSKAEFDTGAAWISLALQARKMGLYAHAMGGILYDEIYETFGIDRNEYELICGVAVGRYGDPDTLPENHKRNESPNARRDLKEIIMEGSFRK